MVFISLCSVVKVSRHSICACPFALERLREEQVDRVTYSAHVLRCRPSVAISPFTSLRKSPCRTAPATTFLCGEKAKVLRLGGWVADGAK